MATAIEKEELACTYACLMLHDAEVAITADNINAVAKAAGVELKPFWAAVFARTLEKADLAEMLNAQPAAAAPAAASPAEAKEEKKAEQKQPQHAPAADDEPGDFGLDLVA